MFPEIHENPLRPTPYLTYSLWSPGTQVMFANVPWDSTYRDVVQYDEKWQLDYYLENQNGVRVDNMSYARVGEPIDLDVPFTQTQDYNYLCVSNPAQPIGGDRARKYYYFIQDTQHISGNNTRIHVQLDVWQTYGYDIRFGNAFIEQGHIGVANENNFRQFGREYLTVPEGLDVGGEYVIDSIRTHNVGTARGGASKQLYEILVQSTIDLTADLGTYEDPKMVMASGSFFENLPNAVATYRFRTLEGFQEFLSAFKDSPHALQGIISIIAIPSGGYGVDHKTVTTKTGAFPVVMDELTVGTLKSPQLKMFENWRNSVGLPERYKHLNKFKTYPYCVLELTCNTGTPLILKPESWQTPDAMVNEIPHFASTSARIMYSPHQYNAGGTKIETDNDGVVRDGGEFLDMATGIFNFPTFMIANDGAKLYLANNKNALAYQNKSADWAQSRALSGNQLAANQASAGIGASQQSTQVGIDAGSASNTITNDQAVLGAGLNAVVSGLGGVAGGPIGIATGLANGAVGGLRTALDISTRNQQLGVSQGATIAQNQISTGLAGYNRDTNKAYADSVTQGDYQNAIAGINAKVQDAALTQPSTVGQVGGESFLLARYRWGVDLKVKLLDPAAMVAVGEYWLRYGYRVSRFARIPRSLHVMSHFSYWKLKETYIISSRCPESFKQTIRGIMEKGVTVWKNPDDIGTLDNGENRPMPGVFL